MIVILAIDALEYNKVEEFGCSNLKQECYGKTDISEFSQPRTMVLWSSFITGENKEKAVLEEGNKEMWNKKWPIKETFFSKFKNPIVLDLPGFSYDLRAHQQSRDLLKQFFETEDDTEKEKIKQKYNQDAFSHHKKIKEEFIKALNEEHDLVLGYFSLADVIGHLNFGNTLMIKMIYREFDQLAKCIRDKKASKFMVLSDHGMESIGQFGDHSSYGFWSANFQTGNECPKITEIFRFIAG